VAATALTAETALAQVLFGKDEQPVLDVIVPTFFQRTISHHGTAPEVEKVILDGPSVRSRLPRHCHARQGQNLHRPEELGPLDCDCRCGRFLL
jgi:hypothetical protein